MGSCPSPDVEPEVLERAPCRLRRWIWRRCSHGTVLLEDQVWLVSKCGPRVQSRSEQWLRHLRFYERTGIALEAVRFCHPLPSFGTRGPVLPRQSPLGMVFTVAGTVICHPVGVMHGGQERDLRRDVSPSPAVGLRPSPRHSLRGSVDCKVRYGSKSKQGTEKVVTIFYTFLFLGKLQGQLQDLSDLVPSARVHRLL